MIKPIFFPLIILTLYIGAYVPVHAQTKSELQKKYSDYLSEKDLFSKIDSDGDVQFKIESRTYFIEVDESDPYFFRLVLPNIWPIESEVERAQVLKAIDIANSKVKVAKIHIVRDDIWVGVEDFMADPDDYESYFDRSLKMIGQCVDYFKDAMNDN